MKKLFFRRLCALAFVFCLLDSSLAFAAQHSTKDIEASTEQFLRDQVSSIGSIEIKPLDSRLRLPACANPLSHDWANGSGTVGRVTILAVCDSSQPWRVHVQARLTRMQEVWVMKRPVLRGDVLTKQMVESAKVELGTQKNRVVQNDFPIVDVDEILGYEFVRNTNSGRVLTQNMLKPNALITKGEQVVLRYSSTALKLQTNVMAITSGALGDRIQVKNPSSGKVFDARVTSSGVAEAIY